LTNPGGGFDANAAAAARLATFTLDARFFFFSRDVQPSRQIAMASELSIFAPLRQALLYCFQFYQ
jgi:hypothetical protein